MLPDGRKVEAGLKETSARQVGKACKASGVAASWDKISFNTQFSSAPAVVANLQTANNEQGAVPQFFSKPWLTLACKDVSATEVSIALDSAETSKVGDVTQTEEVGYIAMETGQGTFAAEIGGAPVLYSAVLTGSVVKGLDDGAVEVALATDMMTESPLVVGSQSTRNGENGGWLRMSSMSGSSVQLVIDEDIYCDSERKHIEEKASILAWSRGFLHGLVDPHRHDHHNDHNDHYDDHYDDHYNNHNDHNDHNDHDDNDYHDDHNNHDDHYDDHYSNHNNHDDHNDIHHYHDNHNDSGRDYNDKNPGCCTQAWKWAR